MEGLVLGLANRGIFLKPSECFGFEKAPSLGGQIDLSNVKPFLVVAYQTIMGQLHEQLIKRPTGSKVTGFGVKE